jgi:hypothetical protein
MSHRTKKSGWAGAHEQVAVALSIVLPPNDTASEIIHRLPLAFSFIGPAGVRKRWA